LPAPAPRIDAGRIPKKRSASGPRGWLSVRLDHGADKWFRRGAAAKTAGPFRRRGPAALPHPPLTAAGCRNHLSAAGEAGRVSRVYDRAAAFAASRHFPPTFISTRVEDVLGRRTDHSARRTPPESLRTSTLLTVVLLAGFVARNHPGFAGPPSSEPHRVPPDSWLRFRPFGTPARAPTHATKARPCTTTGETERPLRSRPVEPRSCSLERRSCPSTKPFAEHDRDPPPSVPDQKHNTRPLAPVSRTGSQHQPDQQRPGPPENAEDRASPPGPIAQAWGVDELAEVRR